MHILDTWVLCCRHFCSHPWVDLLNIIPAHLLHSLPSYLLSHPTHHLHLPAFCMLFSLSPHILSGFMEQNKNATYHTHTHDILLFLWVDCIWLPSPLPGRQYSGVLERLNFTRSCCCSFSISIPCSSHGDSDELSHWDETVAEWGGLGPPTTLPYTTTTPTPTSLK